MTYKGLTMDIKQEDDIRHCTYFGKYGHTTGLCQSRRAAKESNQQRRAAYDQQQHQQYTIEVEALNEKEEDKHAALVIQFEEDKAGGS